MKQLRLLAIAFAIITCAAASIANAGGDHCAAGASAASASKSGDACCATKGKTTASAASASATKSGAACSADMAAHCSADMKAACAKGNKTTMAAGAGCAMHGGATTAMAHADCSACEDAAMCEEEVRSTGSRSKVVALKNGAMIVYTAETSENVRALQSAVARRNEQVLAAMKAGTDGKLCNDCRSLRGAMASGKLHREVVNVESGCMTLITSTDRAMVQKIHAMTGAPMAVHVKS